ncbi:MAG: sulfotransferase family protein [Gemmatimonadetes bacterium]|nr:sulfotransferase family protein [Gemmatimonadota bacterium]
MKMLSTKRGILRRLGTAYFKVAMRLSGTSPGDPIVIDPHRAIYLATPRVATKSVRAVIADLLGIKTNVSMYAVTFPHVDKNRIRDEYPDYFTFAFVRDPWDRVASVYFGKVKPGKYVLYLPRLTMLPVRMTWVYWLLSKLGLDRVAIPFMRGPLITPDISFDDFVALVAGTEDSDLDPHLRGQLSFLTDERGRLIPDFVGRSEDMRASLEEVGRTLGVEIQQVPRLGATKGQKGRNYSRFYSERTWELVRRRFQEDIEAFGYDPCCRATRDGIAPPQASLQGQSDTESRLG